MVAISRRIQWIGAVSAVAIGLVIGFMIHVHPESLRVPAWVAYVAASVFVLGGLCLLAGAIEIIWLQRGLGTAGALALFVVTLWVAFGPGERECSLALPFLQTAAPDALCRGAFSVASLLIGLFLGLVMHRAMRTNPGA